MKAPYQARLIRHPVSRRLMMLLRVAGVESLVEVAAGLAKIASLEKGAAS